MPLARKTRSKKEKAAVAAVKADAAKKRADRAKARAVAESRARVAQKKAEEGTPDPSDNESEEDDRKMPAAADPTEEPEEDGIEEVYTDFAREEQKSTNSRASKDEDSELFSKAGRRGTDISVTSHRSRRSTLTDDPDLRGVPTEARIPRNSRTATVGTASGSQGMTGLAQYLAAGSATASASGGQAAHGTGVGTRPGSFTFALTPAAAVTGPLDLNKNKSHVRIYERACVPITGKKFDLSEDHLQTFLKLVGYRCQEFQWEGLITMPKKEDIVNKVAYPKKYNLVHEYGQLNIADVKVKTSTFIGKPVRMAQDDTMLFNCLIASISESARARIQLMEHEFKIGSVFSGICLLRTLIRESHIDNNATNRLLLNKLAHLDEYMDAIGNDVEKFNDFVNSSTESLAARGHQVPHDLLHCLFKGYAQVKDKTFTSYIIQKQNASDEGDQSITANRLMQLAANKYKALVQTGEWQSPSAEQSELLALQAQVKAQTKQINNLKSGRSSRRDKAKKDKGKATSAKGRKALRTPKDASRSSTKYAAWKTTYPGDADKAKPVTDDRGVQWWWCGPQTGGKCHGIYRTHKAQDCKGSRYRPPPQGKKGKGKSTDAKLKAMGKSIMKAMQAVVQEESDSDSSADSSDTEMDQHE